MSSPILKFPPELLGMVFDNLHPSGDDWTDSWPKAPEVRQSLSTCTLVSRSWHPIARGHLFRDVVYSFQYPHATTGDSGAAWANADPETPSRWVSQPNPWPLFEDGIAKLPLKTLQMFFDFLQRTPIVRSSIRSLRLINVPLYGDDLIDHALFVSLVSSLPRLRDLRTQDVLLPPSRVSGPPPSPISIPSLQMSFDLIRSPTLPICRSLAHFGSLEKCEVVVESSSFVPFSRLDEGVRPDDFPSSVPFGPRSLVMTYIHDPCIITATSVFLSRSSAATNLRRLTLDYVVGAASIGLGEMMKHIGHNLECFKLIFLHFDHWGDQETPTLDLSMMSNLQDLSVGFRFTSNSADSQPAFLRRLMVYLSTMAVLPRKNPRLEKITFYLGRADRKVVRQGSIAWWDPLVVRPRTTEFETHVTGIIHAFGMKGLFVECDDVNESDLRHGMPPFRPVIPQLFPNLAREHLLLIVD